MNSFTLISLSLFTSYFSKILFICRKKLLTRPQESEIVAFVDESVTLDVLERWINATNTTELRGQNTLPTLRRLVRKAFIINYDSRDTEGTKILDSITKNIAVPSRNGRNIANNLQL